MITPASSTSSAPRGPRSPTLPAEEDRGGTLDEIRECIGCNICSRARAGGPPLICTQNPTAGEEYRRGWHPERFEPARKRGQRRAGRRCRAGRMECAIGPGAKRGLRRVHLVDGASEPGGLRWISQLPGLGRVGAGRRLPVDQIDKLATSEFIPGLCLAHGASPNTAQTSSSSRPARPGPRTA